MPLTRRLLHYFKPELSPHSANEPPKSDLPVVVLRNPRQFPIGTGGRKDFAGKLNRMKGYTAPDYAVEYAETAAFGTFQRPSSVSSYSSVLSSIVRTLSVILDEALSGMTPSMRDKCVRFLEHGEGLSVLGPRFYVFMHSRIMINWCLLQLLNILIKPQQVHPYPLGDMKNGCSPNQGARLIPRTGYEPTREPHPPAAIHVILCQLCAQARRSS